MRYSRKPKRRLADAAHGLSSFALTPRAELDLFEIYLFGIERFGLRQAEHYRESLARCFQLLPENPRMGRRAEKIGSGVRRHQHQSHAILYRIVEDGILVGAIIHIRSLLEIEL